MSGPEVVFLGGITDLRSCPSCGRRTAVIDTRPVGATIRRRRACPCGWRFTTYEYAVTEEEGARLWRARLPAIAGAILGRQP